MKFELNNLKALRQKYWLTQYDICRYVGVSDVAYRTWEQRVRKPSYKHLQVLGDMFDILGLSESVISSREDAIKILDEEFDNG